MSELFTDLWPGLLGAFWVTIKLTFFSAIGALVLGVVLTAMRVSPVAILRGIARTYIEIVRNTPLTLIILFCSIGLYQNLGLALAPENDNFIKNNNFWLAVLAFVIYTSTFVAESLRSGINTVHFGQAEAARSLGLSFTQTFRYVVFPQAFKAAVVPLGNTLIALTKNTTIASVIGVAEASLLMKSTIENHADHAILVFMIFAFGFIIITLPMGLLFTRYTRRKAVA
ncbi:amino acid ABC transporter permease [Corynebacterium pyruviciproducens]|uniref:Glutamate transport system permease gluC n=2 Tax=Corynebacterium pyruviciproducens TaxID=598660 RepID=S2Z137_9CORY|nr:amino acid ABC transporter permease [Corynebacterium pyruviciproducens]EPD68005.1 glutamate transport system permease gluC [Corynebacterium pyruviciproducens ATCC BAA-1742]MDK6567249.1 amino acid ABC transporter permease [Corynebacterium pyruviciproducens]MDK7215503.1 amino acid ABC transporter permease [Corynebacterium pyruviciproducens]WOT01853.1 amino acid ABC transporter permease [Corynebacterium pyruviciproducens]